MSDLEDRAGLGERVRRRRERLGLTIDEAAERGPVSPVTWSRVENGGKVRRLSYGAVDRVLDWPEGACVDFLQHGTEPVARPDAASELRELNDRRERPSNLELANQLREQIAELRAVMDEKFGQENKQVRDALINGLEAIVEESSTNRADR